MFGVASRREPRCDAASVVLAGQPARATRALARVLVPAGGAERRLPRDALAGSP